MGGFAKVSSLNSHENGVLAGCFFKNSKYVYKHPSHLIASKRSKTLGFKENILIYCHQTAIFRGYILKIYPPTYVKGDFWEKLHGFTKTFLLTKCISRIKTSSFNQKCFSNYIKVSFGEKIRRFSEKSSQLYKRTFQVIVDTLAENFFLSFNSHRKYRN